MSYPSGILVTHIDPTHPPNSEGQEHKGPQGPIHEVLFILSRQHHLSQGGRTPCLSRQLCAEQLYSLVKCLLYPPSALGQQLLPGLLFISTWVYDNLAQSRVLTLLR